MRYLYLLIFCSIATSALAQTSWIKKDGPEGGVVTDIEYYPGTSTVWAIVDSYVYKSTDDGNTWVRPNNTIFQNNSFNDIEITNNTIYFLGYDFLYTSIDQGSTLVQVAKSKFFQASRIKRLPLSGTLVILASSPSIYYSTSNGTSWTSGATGNFNTGWLAVNSSDQIFVIGNVGGDYTVLRSTNNGASFDATTGFIPTSHVYSLTNNEDASLVYAVTDTDVRASADGSTSVSLVGGEITGTTFSDLFNPSMVAFSRDGLGMYFVDSYNHKLYSKAIGAPTSAWKLRASNFPNSATDVWPSQPIYCTSVRDFPSGAATSSKVVFGTVYGVIRSVTGGASTFEANTGIAQLASSQLLAGRNEGELLMSVDNLGAMRSQNSGDSWTRITSLPTEAARMTTVVTNESPAQGVMLLAASANKLYLSSNGSSWEDVKDNVYNIQGGNNNRAFFQDGSSIYYSNNGGIDWSSALSITNFPVDFIEAIYVPTTTNVIYAFCSVSSSEKYYKIAITYNGSSDITSAVATQLADPPIVGSKILSGNGKLYVYSSSDDKLAVYDGASWSSAKTVPNGNLFVPPNNGYVFVCTNNSPSKVYISRDDGDHFINTDLPASHTGFSVTDVAVTPEGYVFLSFYKNYMLQGKNKIVLPQKPTGLTQVALMGNAMVFRWNDNANNETAYRVMRSSDGGTNYNVIGTVEDICSSNSSETGVVFFTDNTVAAGATYKYKVKAFNEAGDTESTETLSATIPAVVAANLPDNRSWSAQNLGTDPDLPWGVQTPRIVGVQHMGNGRYAVSDILDNTLFTSSSVSGQFYVNGTTTVLGATEGSSNFEQVFANGTGTWNSGTGQFTIEWVSCQNPDYTERITYTLQPNDPIPDAPAIQALINGTSQIEIVWDNILYAKDYILERSTTSESAGFTQVGSAINYPTTSVVDNNVAEGTTYYYRLKARNANSVAGVSDPSEVVAVEFKKPVFIVSATTVSSFVSATLGSYWADFDNDGNEDLLAVNGSFGSVAVATVTIFKNLGNGNFEIKTPTLDPLAYGFSAVSDINGDGKMDLSLAVAETAQVDFYRGNGDFTFTKFSNAQLGELPNAIISERQGIMWGDINNDGRLDVIISGDYNAAIDDRLTVCTQNSNGTFTIADAGDLSDIATETFSTFWIDYNNDTFLDVIVSGVDPTGLYRNNGDGTFTSVPPSESGIALGDFGGITAADFNNDGYMDLVCGGGEHASTVIYMNDKDGSFTLKDATAVSESGFAIAPAAGDINNDGLVDLVVPGFFSLPTQVFINNSSGSNLSFLPVVNEKVNDSRFSHIGAAFGDYDKNGFLDLAMGTVKQFDDSDEALTPAENYLFKNTNTTGNWLQVKLVGKTANKSGLGARVTVTAGGKTLSREVVSASSFVSLNSLTQHFGLGSETAITKVEVRWPTSPVIVQTISNPTINTIITINENADPDPPTFGDPLNVPATANKSSLAQTLSIPVSDNKGVTVAEMFVKSVSGGAFVSVNATSITATTAEFALAASAFDASGVQYYFKAQDEAGNFALSPADAPTHVYTTLVNYTGTDAQIPAGLLGSGGTATGWKVIAIPFELGSNNGIQTVFDELSDKTNKVDYRILKYTEIPAPDWEDYPDKFSTVDRGAGYFINIRTPITIVVGDALVAPSNTRSNLFQLELKAGWNMIGNPYLEEIDWTNVVAFNTITGTGTTFKKFSGGSYNNASAIAAYEGGFVHMDAAATVSIPFNGQTSPGRIEAPSFGNGEWLVAMEVKQGEVTNTFGGVGMHSSALRSYDALDDINGPRWIDFVEMNFSHPEHPIKNFARDVVPVADEFEWKFEFDSNIPGIATMTWDNETYAIESDLYLYDEDTQTPVNMKETNSYSFDAAVSRNFRILYGRNALSKIIPSKIMLGIAHPNPTSNTATIGFSIPERNGKMNVRLDVFDLTGRRVGTLADGEFAAGFYTAEWRAKEEAPDGMYVFRLFAGDEVFGGKIILRR